VVISIFPALDRSADGIAANNGQGGAGVALGLEVWHCPA
jgi:hypothetical protein